MMTYVLEPEVTCEGRHISLDIQYTQDQKEIISYDSSSSLLPHPTVSSMYKSLQDHLVNG